MANDNSTERKAWRSLLIPVVGSAAFFASSVVNILKTYKRYGFPQKAFNSSDYVLLSMPFIIFFLALNEEIENGD